MKSLEVRWPSGLLEKFEGLSVDSIHTLKESLGSPVNPTAKKISAAQPPNKFL